MHALIEKARLIFSIADGDEQDYKQLPSGPAEMQDEEVSPNILLLLP